MFSSGDIDILRTRLTRYCQGYNQQPYDFIAIIDFEATCVAKPPMLRNPYVQEIIEFPIVLIDVAKQTIVRKHLGLDYVSYVYTSRSSPSIPIVNQYFNQSYQIIVNN